MSEDKYATSRQRVRDMLGTAVEEKASNAFCSAFQQALQDAAGGPIPLVPTVVCLEVQEPPTPSLSEAVRRLRTAHQWTDAHASAAAALASGAEPVAERTAALLHPVSLLREIYVKEMRERCYQAMGPVRDELEQSMQRIFARRSDSILAAGLPATQVCWLNQTIRTLADPHVLSGPAADARVLRIDVPRRILPEVEKTGAVVGAVQHRDATKRSGRGVVVAVLDSEVKLDHPNLHNRVIHRHNFTREPWGNPDKHGTSVAGVIAAAGTSPRVGMAPDAVIYNYKVLTTNASSGTAGDFDLAYALQQALEDGARIANVSVQSQAPLDGTSPLVRACDNAWALGMTIVKSAGNGGKNEKTVTSPGDARGVIVVGATGRTGQGVQDYSGRGPVLNKEFCPDLVAPGGTEFDAVVSCTLDGSLGPCGFGTSLAAAHVSGLLALILQGRPDLTPDEQRELLLSQCNASVIGESMNAEGRGLINIAELD